MTLSYTVWRETHPSPVDGTRLWAARTSKGIEWFRTRDEARKAAGLKPARKHWPDQPPEQIQDQPS